MVLYTSLIMNGLRKIRTWEVHKVFFSGKIKKVLKCEYEENVLLNSGIKHYHTNLMMKHFISNIESNRAQGV